MRKLIITAAFAAIALTSVAACADNSEPSPSSSTTTTTAAAPTSAAGDQTEAVCDEALQTSTTAGQSIQTKATELAAAGSDQTKQLQIGTEIITLATNWAKDLTELSNKPVKPEVKAALSEGAATLTSLTNPATLQSTNAAQLETQLRAFVVKLTTACAAS